MVNTGARPSEIAALRPERIILHGAVPHIQIRADDRQVKTMRAIRDIPLTGVSLDAMHEFPGGFPRYKESSASLSATVNSFLRANSLMEDRDDGRTTMYSLRHSFMDRMTNNDVDDRIRRDVFGHRLNTEEYGDGADLEKVHDLLHAFAL